MLTIEYHEKGSSVSDFHAEQYVLEIIELYDECDRDDLTKTVSNGLVVDVFRALIKEGKLDHQQIRFLFNGGYLYPNENGSISEWPIGFCDQFDNVMDRILGLNSR